MLTNPIITEQVASAYSGCVVEPLPGAAEGEAMLLIAGPITSRIQAVQAPGSTDFRGVSAFFRGCSSRFPWFLRRFRGFFPWISMFFFAWMSMIFHGARSPFCLFGPYGSMLPGVHVQDGSGSHGGYRLGEEPGWRGGWQRWSTSEGDSGGVGHIIRVYRVRPLKNSGFLRCSIVFYRFLMVFYGMVTIIMHL